MRLTFLTVCIIMLFNGGAARAQDYPWCVVNFDRTDCSFTTYEQCQATASGYGGCSRNKRTLWSNEAMPRWQAAPAPATPPAARAGRTGGGEAAHHQHRHHHHRQALEIRDRRFQFATDREGKDVVKGWEG